MYEGILTFFSRLQRHGLCSLLFALGLLVLLAHAGAYATRAAAQENAPPAGDAASGAASGGVAVGAAAAAPESAPAGGATATSVTTATTTTTTTPTSTGPSAAGQDSEKPGGEAQAENAGSETREQQLFRAQNTWLGPVGGLHIVDAGSGNEGSLRLQIGVDFYRGHDFLLAGDTDQWTGGTLAVGWTITDYLELFASIANHANYNDKEDPRLLQVLGDTTLGIKGFEAVLPWLTLGGDFRLIVLNTVGDIGPVLNAISYGFRANASIDGRKLDQPIPLLARLNIDYLFDNSASLIEDVEDQRYQSLGADRRERALEDRNLIRRVERFALGINRTDAFTFGLGLEVPLRAADEFFIHPLLEWSLSVPVNRQGYDCLRVETDAGPASPDGCLKVAGLAAMPSTLTFGARVFPPVRGLAFALGLDIGLSGTSTFVRELAGNKPYDVLFALSYAIDTRPPKPVVHEVPVVHEQPKPPPPKPRVSGTVVDASSGAGVANAAIRYPDQALTAQLSDEQGRFTSYELDPGEVRFEVSHPDYEGRVCSALIPVPPKTEPAKGPAANGTDGGPSLGQRPAPPVLNPYTGPARAVPNAEPNADGGNAPALRGGAMELIPMRCELVAKPRTGSLRGQVTTEAGKPVAGARVDLTGPATQSLTTDALGQFVVVTLPSGSYGARVESDAYMIKLATIEIESGKTATPDITLLPKPKEASVELTKQEVRIHKQIFFKLNSAEISEKSNALLSEIADVLLRNPQVKAVEIQGHTDNQGAPEVNQQLSQLRAEAVRTWLVNAGVEAGRLTAKGYGDTRPIEPNITERHRARNRRVQFMIKAQE